MDVVWVSYIPRPKPGAGAVRLLDGPIRNPSPAQVAAALHSAWNAGYDLELVNGETFGQLRAVPREAA